MGVEALARALKGTVSKAAPQLKVAAQDADGFGETVGIVCSKIDRGLTPDFAKRRNVV
jgi:hypothetical protein